MDEETLVEQVKCNKERFEILYDRYKDAIYSFIFYKVNIEEVAQDLTARTFTQALAKIDSYENRQKFSAWLYTIARNEVVSHHRRNWWRCPLEWLSPDQQRVESPIEAKIEHDEQLALVYAALSQLSERDKQVIELRYLEGLSARETAKILKDTPQNIAVRACRAKGRLIEQINVMEQMGEITYV